MAFTEYNHDRAATAIHDVLYDLVPDFNNIRLMCEKYNPDEMSWSDLEETDPEAFEVYSELTDKILDRLEEADIIPTTELVSIPDDYPEWSDEFWDLLDDQIENFVYGYRSTHELV